MHKKTFMEIENSWKDKIVYQFLKEHDKPIADYFGKRKEYEGTPYEIPLIAYEYEMRQAAKMICQHVKSFDEFIEYLKMLDEDMVTAIYDTGFDSFVIKEL